MADLHDTRRVFNLSAAVKAGLIAGLVFMMMEMILVVTVGGGSPWGPPRMIGAIALGPDVLPPPPSFDLGIFAVAMLVHFVLAVVLAILFAFVATRLELTRTTFILAGAVFGLVVYFVNFYLLTAVFPWFAMARGWITFLSHLAFGAVLAWMYLPRTHRTV